MRPAFTLAAFLMLGLLALAPAVQAQSAADVERCFQNPGSCATGGGGAAGGGGGGGGVAAARPGPDYASVLQRPENERQRIQESLRTLDKYNGPVDGNLQSEGTVKAIGDWQKGRGTPVTGKLSPDEVQALHAEASKTPIKRIEPPAQVAVAPPGAPSNADMLKALQAKVAERRKAAEPKADALAQTLIKDLKAYVAADGKSGAVGEQFTYFSNWYRENRAGGRSVGEIAPTVEDYGDAKPGPAATVEVRFELKEAEKNFSQCVVFTWIDAGGTAPRKNARAFPCDDVAGVEKWKSEQTLRSAWR